MVLVTLLRIPASRLADYLAHRHHADHHDTKTTRLYWYPDGTVPWMSRDDPDKGYPHRPNPRAVVDDPLLDLALGTASVSPWTRLVREYAFEDDRDDLDHDLVDKVAAVNQPAHHYAVRRRVAVLAAILVRRLEDRPDGGIRTRLRHANHKATLKVHGPIDEALEDRLAQHVPHVLRRVQQEATQA